MKKKILGVIIAIILVAMAIILTGCGNENKQNEQGGQPITKDSLASKVKVGDYVAYEVEKGNTYISTIEKNGIMNQEFKTTGEEKWRVLNINDDGTVDLVTQDLIKTSNGNGYNVQGGKGYSNLVEELNNICGIYGKGNKAISARSMTYEDIFDGLGLENFINTLNLDVSDCKNDKEKWLKVYQVLSQDKDFNKEITINEETFEPSKDNQNGYIETSSLTVKHSNLTYNLNVNLEKYNRNEDILELLFSTDNYHYCWLANTGIQVRGNQVDYQGYACGDGDLYALTLFTNINHTSKKSSCYVRPVVTIDSNAKVIGGTGTSTDMYVIK